eukprot:TRINITY_DN109574_c0_g1_i1.p1 TRINITY_DN109574_c0_g1~~TRINITY_DN109574_c0_g1_i1.p1  ORF type:complete len:207 (+),score=37.93 TRINITY_DN109574_c0_g1_i1:41-661(+)
MIVTAVQIVPRRLSAAKALTPPALYSIMKFSAVAATLLISVEAGQMHVAKLCRDQTCNSLKAPIMDYDSKEQKCVCRAHPCWDHQGQVHSCPTDEAPFLTYHYDKDKNLNCGCGKIPHYIPEYISKELCAGHFCEDENLPILDYNDETESCICRSHPCLNDDGKAHSCPDTKFPILRYREDEVDGKVVTKCECVAKLEAPKPNSEL